jgi:arsenate reductase
MAEGLVNHFLNGRWEAASAGTDPSSWVHPMAVQVMEELGIAISAQRPKRVDLFEDEGFDVVITVCDDAAKNCPLCLGWGRAIHVGFPDPAAAEGSEEERLAVFREVRDGLRQRVFEVLEQIEGQGR